MKHFKLWMFALPALVLIGIVIAADTAPSARWATKYENLTLPAHSDAMTVVVDFPPGAVFPLHSHGGPVIALVIEGEITLTKDGVSQVYKAGQGFNEPLGQIHEARNKGTVKATVVATYLLPKGAKPDIFIGK
jgi:quercetin dioxygenase-like cupin family protein